MNRITYGVLIALALSTTAGCQRGPERTLDYDVLYRDFAVYNASTVAEYRKRWIGNGLTELDRVLLAGELIQVDPPHGAEYLTILAAAAKSTDPVIAAAAATSLRGAEDAEALDILAGLVSSTKPQVARAAAWSLDFKRQNMVAGALSDDEGARLGRKVDEICGRASLAQYVREIVCRPNPGVRG